MSLVRFTRLTSVALWITTVLLASAYGTVVVPPVNTVGVTGTDVSLYVYTSGSFVIWSSSSGSNLASGCTLLAGGLASYKVSCNITTNRYGLTILHASTSLSQGWYTCQDIDTGGIAYKVAVILLDSPPVCGVSNSTPAIQWRTVTLVCSFSYTSPTTLYTVIPSVSWSLNGTTISQPQWNVTSSSLDIIANGTVIPSYTCNVGFNVTWSASASLDVVANSFAAKSFETGLILAQYCPTYVSITPNVTGLTQIPFGTTFTCSSDGYFTPTYVWNTQSGGPWYGANFTLLTGGAFNLFCTAVGNISGILASDCNRTTNISGFTIVCPSNVTIRSVQHGLTVYNGTSISVKLGDTFTCSASSVPNSSYYWSVDGGLETASNLFTVTLTGNHSVTCRAKINDTVLCNQTTSSTINVYAVDCPSNVTISSDQYATVASGSWISVKVGDTFRCSAHSYPNATYTWTENGVSQTVSNTYRMLTHGNRTLTCQASFADTSLAALCLQNTSITITVFVIACPNVTITPSVAPTPTQVGQTFNCSSAGEDPLASYRWTDMFSSLTAASQQLTVAHAGNFSLTCVATSTMNGLSCSSNATVSGTAIACPQNVSVAVSPRDYLVNETLTCTSVGGDPLPSYSWTNSVPGQTYTVGQTYTLSQPGNQTLTCTANVSGCVKNTTVNVSVIQCPQSVNITPRQTYFTGDVLNCTSTGGYPSPSYQWQEGTSSQTGQTYTLSTTGPHQLTCVASSSSCKANYSLNVTVNACPKNVNITTNPSGGGTYNVGDTLSCTSNGGYPLTSYQWLNGPTSATYTLNTTGTFPLTCVATSAGCNASANATVTVVAQTTTPVPTTTVQPTTTVITTAQQTTKPVTSAATNTAATATANSGGSAAPVTGTQPSGGTNTYPYNTATAASVGSWPSGGSLWSGTATVVTQTPNTASVPTGVTPPAGSAASVTGGTGTGTAATVTANTNTANTATGGSQQTGNTNTASTNTKNSNNTNTNMNSATANTASTPTGVTNPSPGPATTGSRYTGDSSSVNPNASTPSGTDTTSTTQNPVVTIIQIAIPVVLGIAALAVLVGFLLYYLLGAGAAAASAAAGAAVGKGRKQPQSPPRSEKRNELPTTSETSFYAPGYAFQGNSFAGGYGRF